MRGHDLVGDRLPLIVADHGEDKARGKGCGERRAGCKAAEERPPRRLKEFARREDARGGRRQRGFDPVAQAGGRGLLQAETRHRSTHGAERRNFSGAGGTGRQMYLDVAGMAGVKLAIDERMEQNFRICAIHGLYPSASFPARSTIERARASGDITVPTGTPATSGLSWYANSVTSRRT